MKRFLICIAALLPFVLGNAQEFNLVTRAEYSSVEDDHLGNSSFYALVDGDISDNFSYSVETHLLSAYPKDLYAGTLRSDATNWLDWAYLTYDTGKFNFTLGKNAMSWGTFEVQEYDFDCYYELASTYWYNNSVYQWGGKLGWTPSESFAASVEMTTSMYGERPFGSGLYSWALFWDWAPCDWYENLFSLNAIQLGEGSCLNMLNMGHKFSLGGVDLVWDSMTQLQKGYAGSNLLYANCTLSPKWFVQGRLVYESGLFEDAADRFMAGALLNWNPVESLRIHALAAYDTYLGGISYNFGVTWKITL